jgi:hypothetical protein
MSKIIDLNFSVDEIDKSLSRLDIDGVFISHIRKRLSLTIQSLNELVANSTSILSKIPFDSGKFNSTGIVIGRVQSGKTSNFMMMMAMAFDNGFDLSIVIGGNTNELLLQNSYRIKSTFDLNVDKIKILNTKDNRELIKEQNIKQWIGDGCKIIILTLKSPQSKNIQHLSLINSIFDDYFLSNQKILIIDDEGDQATLNTNAYKKNKPTETETYRVITEMRSKLKRHAYLSVTATPQANILIDTTDKLSPDFGALIYPGVGYSGLSVFHGENQDEFVKEILEEDADLLIDKDGGIPESLIDSLSTFFVGNGIRKLRGDDDIHSMLIHPSRIIKDQSLVSSKIQSLLEHWNYLVQNINDIAFKNELEPQLEKTFEVIKNENKYQFNFESIREYTLHSIRNCSPVIVANSLSSGLGDNAELFSTRIYLGGDIMGRGITIPGLAVTYIVRRAKSTSQVDSTEQRARWFGYKKNRDGISYLDVCRIFTTKIIKDDFDSIREHDEEVWVSIENHLKSGNEFKSLPRVFKLREDANRRLELTRKGIAEVYKLDFSGWLTQRFFIYESKKIDNNINVINEFLETFSPSELAFDKFNTHLIYRNIPVSDFLREILSRLQFSEKEQLSDGVFPTLLDYYKNYSSENTMDILIMRYKTFQNRKINEDGKIQQFFRGRNVDSRNVDYPGDRSISTLSNVLQVQIHYISPSNLESKRHSPSFAFHFPPHFIKNRIVKV